MRTAEYRCRQSLEVEGSGLLPISLTRHVAVQANRLVEAIAFLNKAGCDKIRVLSHGAEQEVVARFPSLKTITEFSRRFLEE